MIASTIIVLREILEICLVIGMISAALKEVKNRNKIILLGVMVGGLISTALAFSINQINGLFDGNGQEIFNIIILLTSIICIAWTLKWFNNQGKKLYTKVLLATGLLKDDNSNIWPMLFIIILSISREGAELILFLNGVSIGSNANDMIYGIILGASIGISLGLLLYFGLMKLSTKYFFKSINLMLILLAAGMASQLANYLSASEIISMGSEVLWDSSWLIKEDTIIGKLLNGLVGYSSNPSILQVVFYFSTIAFMTRLLKKNTAK